MDLACKSGYDHDWCDGESFSWCACCGVVKHIFERSKREPRAGSSVRRLAQIIERDGPYCHYCGVAFDSLDGARNRATVDHKIPKSKGGTNALENLLPACNVCNSIKESHSYQWMLDYIAEGKKQKRRQATVRPAPRSREEIKELKETFYHLRLARSDKN